MDKYANLPGIAKNEPDFYETPTLSNSNIKNEPLEDDSSNVQKINISTKDAHDKFNKGSLNTDFVDFSDTITNRRKFGYLVEPESFEWNQDPIENPLQKFKRLEKELSELKVELTQVEKISSEEENKNLLNFNPVDLTKQVENLQKQIKTLHLQSIGAKTDITDLDNKANKKLLVDHLNELKKNLTTKAAPTADKKSASVGGQDNSIVFKLFADLEQVDLQRANKISDLNQRLSNLEKVFGAGNGSVNEIQINKLCSNIENKTLLGLVENLSLKVGMLDTQSIDQIDSRLGSVIQRMNTLNEKKNLLDDQEKLGRVNEIFNMISNWKDITATVPSIVERLAALNELHQKAFQFSSILSRLDNDQEIIKQSIQTSSDTLKEVKKNLESNLDSIKANFDALNQRVLSIENKK